MITELTDIQKWLSMYTNPKTNAEWDKAFKQLSKVHSKYGTVDINIIKSIIN